MPGRRTLPCPSTLLVFFVASVLAAGCPDNDEEGDRTEVALPNLDNSAENARIEKSLIAEVDSQMSLVCKRPVLLGQPLPGPAGGDMLAALGGAPELEACLAVSRGKMKGLSAALWFPEGARPPGVPARLLRTVRPLGDPAADGDSVREVATACEPLAGLVQRAVRHEDACSPYMPGLRGQPAIEPIMDVRRALVVLIRHRLEAGDVHAGVDLLLNGVRIGQDLKRGNSSALLAMLANSFMDRQLQLLELVLNRPGKLGDRLLASIERRLGMLIESEPHPGDFMAGDYLAFCLYEILPALRGEGYTPPGGFGPMGPPEAREFKEPRERKYFRVAMLSSWERLRSGWAERCTPQMSGGECQRALIAWTGPLKQRQVRDHAEREKRLAVALVAGMESGMIEELITQTLQIAAPPSVDYLKKNGRIAFALAGLRLHAAFRRLAEQHKRCPVLEDFDREPLKSLRIDPYSGEPIRIEPGSGGVKWVLRPPMDLKKEAGGGGSWKADPADPAVFIECPDLRSKKVIRKKRRRRR